MFLQTLNIEWGQIDPKDKRRAKLNWTLSRPNWSNFSDRIWNEESYCDFSLSHLVCCSTKGSATLFLWVECLYDTVLRYHTSEGRPSWQWGDAWCVWEPDNEILITCLGGL